MLEFPTPPCWLINASIDLPQPPSWRIAHRCEAHLLEAPGPVQMHPAHAELPCCVDSSPREPQVLASTCAPRLLATREADPGRHFGAVVSAHHRSREGSTSLRNSERLALFKSWSLFGQQPQCLFQAESEAPEGLLCPGPGFSWLASPMSVAGGRCTLLKLLACQVPILPVG